MKKNLGVAVAACLGVAALTHNADASIITESYTGVITSYAGPPGLYSVGETISDTLSYNSSLLTASNGYTYSATGTGNTFMFSYGSFGATSGSTTGAFFTATHFSPGGHYFLDIGGGGGDEAFGGGEYWFTITSLKVSSSPSPPISSVPLAASLPLFGAAIASLGTFARRRKTSLASQEIKA